MAADKDQEQGQASSDASLSNLHILQADIFERVKQLYQNFKKDSQSRKTKIYFQTRINKLENFSKEFDTNHQTLLLNGCSPEHEYFTSQLAARFEESYLTYYCEIGDAFETRFPTVPSDATPSHSNSTMHNTTMLQAPGSTVQLPKLPVPSYSGKLTEWPAFHDVFQQLIHDNGALSSIQKFHFLKQALPADRDQDVHQMDLTEANYLVAWSLIVTRYNNPRLLFMHHMNTLYELPSISKESSAELKHMLNVANVCINEFKRLNIAIANCDHWIVHHLTTKLPSQTIQAWEHSLGSTKEIPTFFTLESFLNNRLFSIDIIEGRKVPPPPRQPQGVNGFQRNVIKHSGNAQTRISSCHTSGVTTNSVRCAHCNDQHILRRCPDFLAKDSFARKLIVDRSKVCLNCLSPTHSLSKCNSSKNCLQCGQRHHTLLHFPTQVKASDVAQSAGNITSLNSQGLTASSNTTQLISASASHSTPHTMILATALVRLHSNATGQSAVVRALIDHGSEGTLVTETVVQALGLPRFPVSAEISGVGGNSTNRCKYRTECTLSSTTNSGFKMWVENAFVLRTLTSPLPRTNLTLPTCPHLTGLELADPNFMHTNSIDVLLGVDTIPQFMMSGIRRGSYDQPIAQCTQLGWIIFGRITPKQTHTISIQCHHSNLETLVQKFFELEARKFQKKPDLYEQYSKVMEEYFELHQITEAITSEEQHRLADKGGSISYTACTLPHHAVLKADSSTTKLRVVYDASCKTSNGKSLNDILCIGPALQNDLGGVILNWRFLQYVFAADIQKMYRCIDVHPEDTHFQRIIWQRENNAIKDYCLTTVTFGTASAPYTAIRIMHQIAQDERDQFPLAEHVLRKEIYVDDLQSGHETIKGALQVRDDVIGALQSAGMELRKWAANHPSLLNSIPPEHMSNSKILEIENQESIKTLGLYWHPKEDFYGFKLKFTIDEIFTKRSILATVARLYDPLGFVAPVIIIAKVILKEVWSIRIQQADGTPAGLAWDATVPPVIQHKWKEYCTNLLKIESLRIPRWLQYLPSTIASLQLHIFCDGSSMAYAACAYVRVQHTNNSVYTHLIAAKSRVTPTKPLTIPRVELCGAVLAAQLGDWLCKQIDQPTHPISTYFWSDATIVLYWIAGDPLHWKTFVANRVGRILESSSASQWRHVPTGDNPADCATRGLYPDQLAAYDLWWQGPSWLRLPESQWPSKIFDIPDSTNLSCEQKSLSLQTHSCVERNPNSLLTSFSSYNKLLFIMAYVRRFIHNSQTRVDSRQRGPVTAQEFQQALGHIVRLVQHETFKVEIQKIKTKTHLSRSNKLSQLSPFLDNEGVLRVRGRLKNALHLSPHQRTPIILPKDHHFTELVIRNAHLNTLHGGISLTLAVTRQTFWILNGKQAVKKILHKCVDCFKHRPKAVTQLMGDLPLHRVNPPKRAFEATGVDYTGALEIKASKFRGHHKYKAYIAVFICLATKAVHLEAVTGLSSQDFLWALQRFIGRRGYCQHIYSDCGTNFIGADKSLNLWHEEFRQSVIATVIPKLTAQQIQWHFNPPHSPNFGGLWEANVKAVKTHLHRTCKGALMTYEQLSTILVQIEACLNSRPLCPLSSDMEDLAVLTPAHFLIGDSMMALPNPSASDKSLNAQFLEGQRLLRTFWHRWSSDWLSHLQSRPKWQRVEENLRLHDIVIIKDDRLPPNEWKLGRIVELHPGSDNLIRVASIKTASGIYKRSLSKICPLPLATYSEATE
ncbi:uncharacterized protein [Drosophila takahashii]|uniref:uncharacterized protein COX7CL isoform X2 n=2 Tax=Drosophila takahashii TaxID=29030 RepID=UPI001CF8E6CA|nr:uncharacterized protein LOC108063783 isoform X2 [Drosophila takahashii]XP_044250476.1 uncharacterized protein LOC123003078 isoform X2 [Drosophila takahashii]XP_044252030.1 uncharacterized protein LOC123003484 isoform X2 [Drosophila takahashii]